jgi:hypothetical protein
MLSVYSVRKTVTELRRLDAQPYADGYFIGYTTPQALHGLQRDAVWKDWNVYQNSKETINAIVRHEVEALAA